MILCGIKSSAHGLFNGVSLTSQLIDMVENDQVEVTSQISAQKWLKQVNILLLQLQLQLEVR
jgi:hypothetical protein